MPGTVVGKAMNLGYLGQIVRNGDEVVNARSVPLTDKSPIYFGDVIFLNPDTNGGTYSSTQSLVAAQTQGSTTSGNTAVTITGDATGIAVGQQVIGTGIAAGTTVAAVAGTAVTLSQNATATGTGVALTFLSANLVAANFVGFAVRQIKSFETYIASGNSAPTVAYFRQGTKADALKRGNAILQILVGTPKAGGKVYLRVALNSAVPAGVIGGIEGQADGNNTIQLPNASFWSGYIDGNKQIEVALSSINAV